MKSLELNRDITAAVEHLRNGQLVVIPTETVYGMAADACRDDAVTQIFALKNRPTHNPLIVHCFDATHAFHIAQSNPMAVTLAQHFWPGPLTMVLPLTSQAQTMLSPWVTAGLPTIAVRVPAHSITQQLLHDSELYLAAPSANPSNTISPTSAEDVRQAYGAACPFILDGGPTRVGIESTIIEVHDTEIHMLRPGGISLETLEEIGECPVHYSATPATTLKAPGMMRRHYAPTHPMRMNVIHPEDNEVFIGFGVLDGDYNLSPSGNLVEAAAGLFRCLRQADETVTRQSKQGIAVAPVPGHGLGLAINDRLSRAATPVGE